MMKRGKWFLGGCVPATHEPSACLVDDICCVDHFPFAPTGELFHHAGLTQAIEASASAVWDRTREANITVAAHPSIVPPSEVTVTCHGTCAPIEATVCPIDVADTVRRAVWVPGDDTPTLGLVRPPTFAGTYLVVELLPDAIGTVRGRLLHVPFTDVSTNARWCPFDGDPRTTLSGAEAARSGELILDHLPAPGTPDPHGTLRATMSDCFTVEAVF